MKLKGRVSGLVLGVSLLGAVVGSGCDSAKKSASEMGKAVGDKADAVKKAAGDSVDMAAKKASEAKAAMEKKAGMAAKKAGMAAKKPMMMNVNATKKLGTLPDGIGLAKGTSVPNVTAKSVDGSDVTLKSLLGGDHVLLTFYRGAWCPFCTFQVRELQKNDENFKKLGVKNVLVSVDKPEVRKKTAMDRQLTMTLLSDPDLELHKGFKLLNKMEDGMVGKLKGMGMDIPAHSGKSHNTVAHPATFLISPKGEILFAHAEVDYKSRPSAEQLLGEIKKILKK